MMSPDKPGTSPAGAFLALAGALALAFPPQVHPETGAPVALLLALGLVAARPALSPGVLASGLLLAAFNLAVSLAPARTLDGLASLALPIGAFVLARALPARDRSAPGIALAVCGAGLGVLALAQRAFLLAREAAAARAAGAAPEIVERLAQGRPFGTHELPAALAGALLVALAACGAWGFAHPRARRLAAVPAALAAAGFAVTGSIGGLIGLFAGALVMLLPALPRLTVRQRWIVLGVAALAVAAVVGLRPLGDLGLARPDHPLRLRFGNWRGAVLVGLLRPIAGTGLGSFGALYPHVRRAGDLATIYAHDSWLQLAVELGLPGLALLGAALWLLWRRVNDAALEAPARWALAGTVAFAAHNLVDFTALLPGVAVPAAILAGFAFAPRDGVPRAPRRHLLAAGALALVLVASAAAWTEAALARRALEGSARALAAGDPAGALEAADLASARAPFDVDARLRAARFRLAAAAGFGAGDVRRARAIAASRADALRLTALDPASPAPWHLLGDVELAAGRPTAAWPALEQAVQRHPADADLAARARAVEGQLRAAGFFAREPSYGGAIAHPTEFDWELWDLLLLGLQLLLLGLVVRRWIAPGPAPALALALVFIVLASAWGEGGALPSVRFGRAVLVTAAALTLLWPRRQPDGAWTAPRLPLEPLALLAPVAAWAALAAAVAPDAAAARDGVVTLAGGLMLLVLAWQQARDNDAWPEVVLGVFVASATLASLLFLVQKGAALLGIDLTQAEVPLRADRFRPAADFLHPGHLGTYLVAAGLALAGFALGQEPRWRTRWSFFAGGLVLAGLAGGARASLLALAAGGAVLALAAGDRRLRLAVGGLTALGVLAGGGAVVWRFAAGDPFAFSRLGIWRASLAAIADRPLTGFGPGGFASLARQYAFADPAGASVYGKTFEGPHSDLLALFVGLGIPGALLGLAALVGLGALAVAVVRAKGERAAIHAGLLAAVAALLAHGLVDDFLDVRPAVAVAAAVLLGTLAGLCPAKRMPLALGRPARIALTTVALTWLAAGEGLPWLADNVLRAGDPETAAAIDPARPGYWIASARLAAGEPAPRLATALFRTGGALQAAPARADVREERARVLDAACRGPLPDEVTCRAALVAWDEAVAAWPTSPLYRRARARLKAALGDGASAETDLRAALALEPNFLGARLDLARALAEGGRGNDARAEYAALAERVRKLAGTKPDSPYESALLAVDRDELALVQKLLRP